MNRMQSGVLGLALSTLLCVAAPAWADLQGEIDQAVDVLERMPPGTIPASALAKAHGIAILTAVKGAAGLSIEGAKGVVVARTDSGWSAPSGVGAGAVGFGIQLGVRVTRFVFLLNTPAAVQALSEGNVQLGADLSAAFFPWGASASAVLTPQAAVYGYGDAEGLYIGASGDLGAIGVREQDNTAFYGKPVPAISILRGEIPSPPGAAKLQEALAKL